LYKKLEKVEREREELNLNSYEMAFYNALDLENQEVKALGNNSLIKIAKESIESIEELKTIDWVYKETIQAKMKVTIKRVMKKYNYPLLELHQAIERMMQLAKSLQ